MFYIPTDWIVNIQNEEKIHEILDKVDGDVRDENSYTPTDALNDLKALGENIITKKIENGEIIFGA